MTSVPEWLLVGLGVFCVFSVLQHHYAIKRIDKRIDAVIALLKQRGIDILSPDYDVDDYP